MWRHLLLCMSKCVYFVWFNIYLHFKKVVSMFCVSDVCSTRDLFIYLVIIQPQLTNNSNSVIKINIWHATACACAVLHRYFVT